MKLLIKLTINTFTLLIVAYILPGFHILDLWSAVVTAVVIGIVNTFIKPILHIITLPISIVTLGLAAFFINVVLLYLISFLVPGFTIENFITAIIASILLSIVGWFLHKLASE